LFKNVQKSFNILFKTFRNFVQKRSKKFQKTFKKIQKSPGGLLNIAVMMTDTISTKNAPVKSPTLKVVHV
jgi:hypothetical protein